jgi:hypothetical protein
LSRFAEGDLKPSSASRIPTLLKLPVEIITMILAPLPPSSLISFFRSSNAALDHASAFFRRNPKQFYRCIDTKGLPGHGRNLILALSLKFPQLPCAELDMRWEIISKVTDLAQHVSKIPEVCTAPTANVEAPLQSVDHPFGYSELFTELPVDLETIKVHGIEFQGHHYICGIELLTKTTHQLLANDSKVVCLIDVSHIELDTIPVAHPEDMEGERTSMEVDSAVISSNAGQNNREEMEESNGFELDRAKDAEQGNRGAESPAAERAIPVRRSFTDVEDALEEGTMHLNDQAEAQQELLQDVLVERSERQDLGSIASTDRPALHQSSISRAIDTIVSSSITSSPSNFMKIVLVSSSIAASKHCAGVSLRRFLS